MNEEKMEPTRPPDIAFWFDEEDSTRYLVRVKEGLFHHQLVQAFYDLLAKALAEDSSTIIGEFKRSSG